MKKVLVATTPFREEFRPAAKYAQICWMEDMKDEELDGILPSIDCVLVHGWPKLLDDSRLAKMRRLRFIQSALAGVNHVPFSRLDKSVIVCSNAGGYSSQVAEYAFALLLAAAKNIPRYDAEIRAGTWKHVSSMDRGREVRLLKGRGLGVIGYGGIGKSAAAFGRAFGMRVGAFGRSGGAEKHIEYFRGSGGLRRMLEGYDVFILVLPLTRLTEGIIGKRELDAMRRDVILVNVGRAEVVEQRALYRHLKENPGFIYATDVWWLKDGREQYAPELPFLSLDNFIGTPHASGPSASASGDPVRCAVANLVRYLRGARPLNVIERSEYL